MSLSRAFFLLALYCILGSPAVFAQSNVLAVASVPAAPTDSTTLPPRDRVAELSATVTELQAELDSMRAAPPPPAPPAPYGLDFSGQIFASYGLNTTDTAAQAGYNRFAVERLYLTVQGAFSEEVGFRATTDVVQTDEASAVMLKYAYLNWKPRPWLTVRGGVIQTAWIPYVHKIWRYRGVAQVHAHYGKYETPADVGLSATAQLPARLGEVALHVQNGNGFKNPETDRFKDLSGRLVLTPFATHGGAIAPLQVAGHAYYGHHQTGEARERWGALLAYPSEHVKLGIGYEMRSDGSTRGSGVTAFGELGLRPILGLDRVSLIGLVDRYDLDRSTSDDAMLRTVAGVVYRPMPALAFSLDYQRVSGMATPFETFDGRAVSADASVYLHVIINY